MRSQKQIELWIDACVQRLKNPHLSKWSKEHDREQAIILMWVLGKTFQEAFDVVDKAEYGDAAPARELAGSPQG